MGIYWQTQKLYDGETRSFDFNNLSDDVTGYLAGIAGFQLAFGSYHHPVQDAGVTLDVNKSGAKLVQITARLRLESDAGDRSSATSSWVFVTVVVWTGGPEAALLDGAPTLPRTLQTEIDEVSGADAALSSFRFRFSDGQGHKLTEALASVDAMSGLSTESSDEQINLSGNCEMHDQSVISAEVDLGAAVIAISTDSGIPFEMQVATIDEGATDFGRSNSRARATFTGQIQVATALLAAFDISFDEDSPSRYLSGLKAGAMSYDSKHQLYRCEAPQIEGQDVVVTTNLSMYQDSHTNHQSVSNQGTFLIIASEHTDSEISAAAEAAPAAPIPEPPTKNSKH